MIKNLFAIQETWVQFLGLEDPTGRRKWLPIPVFLPGKSYGQRSQATVHGVAKSRREQRTQR